MLKHNVMQLLSDAQFFEYHIGDDFKDRCNKTLNGAQKKLFHPIKL